jgi:hypothetical protein
MRILAAAVSQPYRSSSNLSKVDWGKTLTGPRHDDRRRSNRRPPAPHIIATIRESLDRLAFATTGEWDAFRSDVTHLVRRATCSRSNAAVRAHPGPLDRITSRTFSELSVMVASGGRPEPWRRHGTRAEQATQVRRHTCRKISGFREDSTTAPVQIRAPRRKRPRRHVPVAPDPWAEV